LFAYFGGIPKTVARVAIPSQQNLKLGLSIEFAGNFKKLMFIPQTTTQSTSIDFYPIFAAPQKALGVHD